MAARNMEAAGSASRAGRPAARVVAGRAARHRQACVCRAPASFLLCDDRSCTVRALPLVSLFAVLRARPAKRRVLTEAWRNPTAIPATLTPASSASGFNDKSKKMYSEIVVEQIRELSAWLA